jgi:hypothetical protein
MDRDTLQDDLDLILAPSRDAHLPGAWDWEPPLGTVAPVASSATEPTEPEETETETSGDPEEGATDDEDEEDD